jgi:hypothetical protein
MNRKILSRLKYATLGITLVFLFLLYSFFTFYKPYMLPCSYFMDSKNREKWQQEKADVLKKIKSHAIEVWIDTETCP